MNTKIEEGIQEAVSEAVSRSMSAIRYNLCNTFGGLLFSLKLELEKDGLVCGIDELIGAIMSSSRYTGPEGEQYPEWIGSTGRHMFSKDDKEAKKRVETIMKSLEIALQRHGIYQSWNIGSDNAKRTLAAIINKPAKGK